MANRGIEALAMLFLVVVVASLPLVPGQPVRWLGAEILASALATFAALIPLQASYLRELETHNRSRAALYLVAGNFTSSVAVMAVGGAVLTITGDLRGFYFLPPGILLSFLAVAANAWVLLIEINR